MPGPVTWPVIHAGLAIPYLWAIVWITTLAYFSSVGPVVARAPVLAAGTRAAAAIRGAGVVARQRRRTACWRE
eukprot:9401645-Alexandrium_andersonii.AAC.1